MRALPYIEDTCNFISRSILTTHRDTKAGIMDDFLQYFQSIINKSNV